MEINKWGSSQCAITADYLNERKLKENKTKLPYSYLGRALLGLIQSEDGERGRSLGFFWRGAEERSVSDVVIGQFILSKRPSSWISSLFLGGPKL